MHTHRFLKATAIAAVSLALIGCSDDNDNGVSSDVQEVLDAYSASYNEADADAFLIRVDDVPCDGDVLASWIVQFLRDDRSSTDREDV